MVQFPVSAPETLREPFLSALREHGVEVHVLDDRPVPPPGQIGGGAEVLIELGKGQLLPIADGLIATGIFAAVAAAVLKLRNWVTRIRIPVQLTTGGMRTFEYTTDPIGEATDPDELRSRLEQLPGDVETVLDRLEVAFSEDANRDIVTVNVTIERRIRTSNRTER